MNIRGGVFYFFAGVLYLVIVGYGFAVFSVDTIKAIDKFFQPMSVVYAVYGETDCKRAVDAGTGKEISCDKAMKGRYDIVYIAHDSLRTAK